MAFRKLALVVAAFAVLTAPAAHAAEPTETGYNNGDEGFLELTWGLPGGTSDSVGDATVDARCEFHQQQPPGSNWAEVVVEGHAQAGLKGQVPASSVGLMCRLYAYNVATHTTGAKIFEYAETTAGTAALWIPPQRMTVDQPYAYKICTITDVAWRDFTHTMNATESCYLPSLVPLPPI